MTESEWMACADPAAMLLFLRFKCGVRKLRLFTVACYRREWGRLDEKARRAVEAAEQLANDRDRIVAGGLRAAKMDADAAFHAAMLAVGYPAPERADLLRCIFGPLPFRPVRLDAAWLSGTVVLPRAIYESHCRGKGPHTRGCWVVDGLLEGREGVARVRRGVATLPHPSPLICIRS
jgi:hypothetical protein